MAAKKNQQKQCDKLLKIIGDYWTLSLVMELKKGELRFCQLQRNVGNVNPVTLTNRLKRLEDAGFINRREESLDKLSVTYSLNKQGLAMLPIIDQIQAFAEKFHK